MIINPYSFGVAYDPDAQAFFTASGLTGATNLTAINNLVVALKGYGIWTKMKAIYPFVGGTAALHKWNLKDPRDLDAAFRLVFLGGYTHSSTGMLPNGVNSHAETKLSDSLLTINNAHISIYSRTISSGVFCDIGVLGQGGLDTSIFPNVSNLFYARIQATSSGMVANTDSRGFYLANRVSNSFVQGWKNSVKSQLSNLSINNVGVQIYLNAHHFWSPGSSTVNRSNRELAFASIGDGLTDTEAANFYTAVQAYQTTLSRNV